MQKQFSVVPAPPGWEAIFFDADNDVVRVPVLAWAVQAWIKEQDKTIGDWLSSTHAQPVVDGHGPHCGYLLKTPDGRIMDNTHEEFKEEEIEAQLLRQQKEEEERQEEEDENRRQRAPAQGVNPTRKRAKRT